MSDIKRYSDLQVWQKSMDLAVKVYKLAASFPDYERYALADQIRRSAISVPSNIAEGFERSSTKEYVHFLSIANGSRAELNTQIELCERLGYIGDASELLSLCDEVGRMLVTMIKNLNNKQRK